jgi:hypothetical protein
MNVGLRRLAHNDWQYFIWVDSHQLFTNSFWWEETIYKLEKSSVLHMAQYGLHVDIWNQSTALTTIGVLTPTFGYLYRTQGVVTDWDSHYMGNVWAINRNAYEGIGYIYDYCLTGGCDSMFARSTLKNKSDSTLKYIGRCELIAATPWIENGMKVIKGKIDFLRGGFIHLWHERSGEAPIFYTRVWNRVCPNLERDFYRDENFTLYTTNQDLLDVGHIHEN